MVNIPDLIDDARCSETARAMRWPDGASCPHGASASVIKNGREDTPPHRRRDEGRDGRHRFDDLTHTSFAGHHQPLRTWIIGPDPRGLNRSGSQIAKQLDRNQEDAPAMIRQSRRGIVDRRPPVPLSGEVECDEVSVVAGPKGHPEAVKKRGGSGDADA